MKVYVLIVNEYTESGFFAGEVYDSEEEAGARVAFLTSTMPTWDREYCSYTIEEIELNAANGPVRER